ncbi:VWA domain-containing protein [uncultured Pelagimonas sp.]|uniref:vWA domain-containing protein n=1 Tax=uncultured Pelagimonas sp. TaxID=1618102 RepID=UPI00261E2C91|nr:VWA domain-containing protein [uncultured Pelagimonas sp.]
MVSASEMCTEDAMIVFDGSGSMAEMGFNDIDEPRIFEARRALHQTVPAIGQVRRLGLVIYGPGGEGGCGNVDVRFAPKWQAAPQILDEVDQLEPDGDTPLTEAVAAAANTLNYKEQPGAIVLVTDGKETCGGNPCALAAELSAEGHDLTVHVIGYKVRGDQFAWEGEGHNDYKQATSVARCLADRTGGQYVSAETVNELIGALRVTLGCSVIGRLD